MVHQARRAALAAVFGVAGTVARGVLGALIVGTLGVLVGVLVLVGGAVGGLVGRAVRLSRPFRERLISHLPSNDCRWLGTRMRK